jgi:hypothetical protein
MTAADITGWISARRCLGRRGEPTYSARRSDGICPVRASHLGRPTGTTSLTKTPCHPTTLSTIQLFTIPTRRILCQNRHWAPRWNRADPDGRSKQRPRSAAHFSSAVRANSREPVRGDDTSARCDAPNPNRATPEPHPPSAAQEPPWRSERRGGCNTPPGSSCPTSSPSRCSRPSGAKIIRCSPNRPPLLSRH